jgi:hypothetical protein
MESQYTSNLFNKTVYAARHVELRIVVQDGLLSPHTHKLMKWISSYVSAVYGVAPSGMDLEGALFEVDDALCRKIVKDIKRRFRHQLKYIEVECI